jgi:hypothetical protein
MEETLTEKQQYFRQYYQDNKDKYRARANSYYHNNRERMMKYYREYYAQWYEANKDWVNTSRRNKRYQLNTPRVHRNITPSVQRNQLTAPSVQRNITLSFE